MFRAIWPITDPDATWSSLVETASTEVPLLAARAHARITGAGRFTIADSRLVPGSGRTTKHVLMFEAPAVMRKRREYHREAS